MKKIFTLAAAVLASFSLWADDATFTMSEIFDGTNQSAEVSSPVDAVVSTTTSKSNAKTGKLGSDGNYFEIVLSSTTFSAVSMNGYINTSSTDKNWAFQFSTDNGSSWSEEATQANDGDKTAHDIAVEVPIPEGANGFRVIRRAGTSTIVNSITLTLGSAAPQPVSKVTLEGPTEGFVGTEYTYKATANASNATFVWFVNDAVVEEVVSAIVKVTPPAAGTYNVKVGARNEYNEAEEWIYSDEMVVTISEKPIDPPAGEVCASLILATSGETPVKGGEAALAEGSVGGKIIFVGAKDDKFDASFVYTDFGLQMSKGGADSVRVVLDNNLAAGSVIELNIRVQVDSKERGFIIRNLAKEELLKAAWNPAEDDFERTIKYTVAAEDGIDGNNAFIIQRSNSAILKSVIVSGCGEKVPTAIDNTEATVKAVKVIRNGQLLIEKNGVLFNAQGTIVK